MFENTNPIQAAHGAQFSVDSGPQGAGVGMGESLRKMEWSELTARLGAARDLRLLLKRDASHRHPKNTNSFSEAAARYFRTRNHDEDDCEPGVNPVALERCKGSRSIVCNQDQTNRRLRDEDAEDMGYPADGPVTGPANGDAREDR